MTPATIYNVKFESPLMLNVFVKVIMKKLNKRYKGYR